MGIIIRKHLKGKLLLVGRRTPERCKSAGTKLSWAPEGRLDFKKDLINAHSSQFFT